MTREAIVELLSRQTNLSARADRPRTGASTTQGRSADV